MVPLVPWTLEQPAPRISEDYSVGLPILVELRVMHTDCGMDKVYMLGRQEDQESECTKVSSLTPRLFQGLEVIRRWTRLDQGNALGPHWTHDRGISLCLVTLQYMDYKARPLAPFVHLYSDSALRLALCSSHSVGLEPRTLYRVDRKTLRKFF